MIKKTSIGFKIQCSERLWHCDFIRFEIVQATLHSVRVFLTYAINESSYRWFSSFLVHLISPVEFLYSEMFSINNDVAISSVSIVTHLLRSVIVRTNNFSCDWNHGRIRREGSDVLKLSRYWLVQLRTFFAFLLFSFIFIFIFI